MKSELEKTYWNKLNAIRHHILRRKPSLKGQGGKMDEVMSRLAHSQATRLTWNDAMVSYIIPTTGLVYLDG